MLQDLLYRDHRAKASLKNEEAAMTRQADRHIRRLLDAGLIERGMVWYESEQGFPYPSPYNQITAKGAAVLEEAGLSVRFKSHRKDKGQDSARHALEISRFYVALQRACWWLGAELSLWYDDRQLAALDASSTLLENVPDAFFVVEYQGRTYSHFFEADRGTETLVSEKSRKSDLLTKFTRYGRHIKDDFLEAPFFDGLPRPIVLTVTTGGERRMQEMMATAIKAGGAGSYWFATAAEVYADKQAQSFWRELWHVSDGVSCRSLRTRLELS